MHVSISSLVLCPTCVLIHVACCHLLAHALLYRTQEIREKEAEQTAALHQDIRDMEFFLRTSQEMELVDPAVQSDLRDGTVLLGKGDTNSSTKKGKSNSKKGKKKR